MTDKERKDIIKNCCDIWNKLKEKSDIVEVLIQEKSNNFDLEQENKQLKEQLAEKNKEINKLSREHFEMFGDMKDYKNLWLAEQRKVEDLKEQLAIREKALELVCKDLFDYNDERYNYYIKQAKESINGR